MSRLPPLPNIQEIIRFYKLRAIRSLSQNFLLDMNLNKKIIRKAGNLTNNVVIEVGPGPGGITRAILEKDIDRLIVIEKDKRFLPSLETISRLSGKNMRVVHGDILNYSLDTLIPEEFSKPWDDSPSDIHIIGNLPFNVSTPLIIKFLKAISERTGPWKFGRTPLTLTFQKEVAERMVSQIGVSERCRLSVMCQHLCKVKLEFVIPGKAFTPSPKVDVGVVKFLPLKQPLIDVPFLQVEKVLRHFFHYRQKKCYRGAETLFPADQQKLTEELFTRSEVDPFERPFLLIMEEYQRICRAYSDICEQHPEIFEYDYRAPQSLKHTRLYKNSAENQTKKHFLTSLHEDFDTSFKQEIDEVT
ncbi:hypothetical protein LOTGIDRAFT_112074 [Lottia gigantea]|uniref:rRNA adenine N(6)-methyltransferase n=1 Tax=Lottia gigantea TaxID=225164 RepID=V4A9D4_LOTGI|nr:hypothetical protein LOTGIDRAFT_112074 [Lottia gigantea]ESP00604.1 hypothetical protein LOTGIDRAFT_112074 [Lottia gigantea]